MLDAGDHVLVSVSGGPDSVALLSFLHVLSKKLCLTLSVVHFNHGLRLTESEEDALFVAHLCQDLAIPCVVRQLDMKSLSPCLQGLSLQEAARNIRYQELARLASDLGANKIATGHTADDQAETMVMWLLRGTGTGGLGGIPPIRDPHVIRPLLAFGRSELLLYLKEQGLTYRIDSSNAKPIYLRNRIRKEVVPLLKQYNPNLNRTIARQADIVREEDIYLDQLARGILTNIQQVKTANKLTLDRTGFLHLPLAMKRRVVRLVVQEMTMLVHMPGFDSVDTIMRYIANGRSGSKVAVHGVSVSREYEHINFLSLDAHSPFWKDGFRSQGVAIPSQIVWPLTGQTIDVSLLSDATRGAKIDSHPHLAKFDADSFSYPLVVRSWKAGDRFHPLGMGGRKKKLQDYFSDIKLERSQRHRVPLLVAPEGIVWVGGYRMDHRFRVTGATQKVLVANLSERRPLSA